MIKGIFIFESGGLQQIGEVSSLQGIINTIRELLPILEQQERDRVLSQLSNDELEALIKQRKEKR